MACLDLSSHRPSCQHAQTWLRHGSPIRSHLRVPIARTRRLDGQGKRAMLTTPRIYIRAMQCRDARNGR